MEAAKMSYSQYWYGCAKPSGEMVEWNNIPNVELDVWGGGELLL